jgi:hypothetical protein
MLWYYGVEFQKLILNYVIQIIYNIFIILQQSAEFSTKWRQRFESDVDSES